MTSTDINDEAGVGGASDVRLNPPEDRADTLAALLLMPPAADGGAAGRVPENSSASNNRPRLRSSYVDLFFGQTYGKWCGASQSGFINCCSGAACPACSYQGVQDGQSRPTAACLAACPPTDAMDEACAAHDTCLAWPSVVASSRLSPPANCGFLPPFETSSHFCGCDAQLVASVQAIDPSSLPLQWGYGTAYRGILLSLFTSAPCWSYDAAGTSQCYFSNAALPSLWTYKLFEVTSGGTCYSNADCSLRCGSGAKKHRARRHHYSLVRW